jgi:hypothetical protein
MPLLDELAEPFDEPERPARRPLVGPGVLSPQQLDAMRRVVARELPARPEPLPIWVPPTFDDDADDGPLPIDACPNCGEDVEITRIDLTANAGWLRCRACGLRWGGSIGDRSGVAAG